MNPDAVDRRAELELELEVDELVSQIGPKPRAREILLTSRLAQCGLPVDVDCPDCSQRFRVVPYPNGWQQGCSVKCECGSSEFRGL
jgi:hypothetical protein